MWRAATRPGGGRAGRPSFYLWTLPDDSPPLVVRYSGSYRRLVDGRGVRADGDGDGPFDAAELERLLRRMEDRTAALKEYTVKAGQTLSCTTTSTSPCPRRAPRKR